MIKMVLKLIVLTLLLSVGLSECYNLVNVFLNIPWLSAALFNTFLAVLVLLVVKKRNVSAPSTAGTMTLVDKLKLYFPALFILFASVFLALMSNLFSPNSVEKARIEYFQIAWILWIPVVEEIVFRVGVGNFFRKLGSISLGSYFSAIVFALVHSSLSLKNLFSLNFFLPLGPLLLGLIAEFLYLKSDKKVFPIIAFHASCNLSVVVFSMFDARWLTWLRLLYI